MLIQLHIKHLVTIQELTLDFQQGCTVITGETGAGKSILIDAIELALGARVTTDVIQPGYDKADISLLFNIETLKDAAHWLMQNDLYQESECLIRRTIHRDGRSRSFINGLPVTLQSLRSLGELLMQIHSQHEHLSLLKPDVQRQLLDRYAAHADLTEQVRTLAETWNTLNQEAERLRALMNDHLNRSEFLKFQLKELEALQLTPNEFSTLDLEHKQLAHADDLLKNLNTILNLLTDNEDFNISHSLNLATNALESIQEINPKITAWQESLKNISIHITDLEDELRHYLDSMDLNPERLQWIEERISLLFEMARKYKVSPNDLYELQQSVKNEYATLETSDLKLRELNTQLDIVATEYVTAAQKLSQSRLAAAKKLAGELTTMMRQLALTHAEFQVSFEYEKIFTVTPYGLEKIVFQLKTNVGQSFNPLAKIISGGELSRVALGIHMITADTKVTPSLIFDEVDVGIGGSTNSIVGQLLRRLGHLHQVICITHQPQVAAYGHHHLRVQKKVIDNATYTQVAYLSSQEKIHEIARMLGGIEMTKKTLAHARELIDQNCRVD